MRYSIIFFVAVVATSLLASSCAKKSADAPVLTSTKRTETVRYNKRDYAVSFKYNDAAQYYDVSVKRPKKPMSGSTKERDNAVQVASSTVSYFSCPKDYRGRLVPGSAVYGANKIWKLAARCQLQK